MIKHKPEYRFKDFLDDWEQKKLSEVVSINSGKDYKHLSNGDIPVYGTGGYMLSVSEALSESNDAIGIGRKGTIDRPYILRAPFWTVDTLFYCIPRINFDLNYIFAIFEKINWKSLDESTGVPSLSKTVIASTGTHTPSLPEQRKIGAFFRELDYLLTLHQQKVDTLKEQKQTYLKLIFPAKGQKVPALRFQGFEGDWEEKKLGEVAEFRRGSFPQPYGQKEWYDGKGCMPFVQVVDVTENMSLVDDTKQKISVIAQSKSVFVPKGKVIVTLQGSIGRVAVTQYDSYVDRTLLIFENYIIPVSTYFWEYTIQKKFTAEKEKAPGGTIKTITKATLTNFNVSLPTLPEQKAIGAFFQELDRRIAKEEEKLAELKEMKQTLLRKMFL